MTLKIKDELETTVALNNITREMRNFRLRVDMVEKQSLHNSRTNVETQKAITIGKIEEAEKKLKLSGSILKRDQRMSKKRLC